MLICVMRHGDAEAYTGESGDAERALTSSGHSENRRVAAALRQRQSRFQSIWVSPYRRAQQTAADVLLSFPEQDWEQCAFLTPESQPGLLLEQLAVRAADNILLIGHNPLVSRFVALLTTGGPSVERYLGTSHLVAIETEVAAPACGVLQYYLAP